MERDCLESYLILRASADVRSEYKGLLFRYNLMDGMILSVAFGEQGIVALGAHEIASLRAETKRSMDDIWEKWGVKQ